MGYRSDVKCAFVFTDEFVRDAFFVSSMANAERKLDEEYERRGPDITDSKSGELEWFRDEFSSCVINGDPVLLLEMDNVKWYDDFWFVKFTAEMQEECVTRGGAFTFIRLGEEIEDVEVENSCHENFSEFYPIDYLTISRDIVIQ